MRFIAVFCLMLALAGLSSCSNKPAAPGPILASFSDVQSGKMDTFTDDGASYSNIIDKLNAIPQDVYADTAFSITDSVSNRGLPSKGIKVVVRGDLIQGKYIALPESAEVSSQPDKDKPKQTVDLDFSRDKAGGWVATAPDLSYGDQIFVTLELKAKKGGKGDVEIFVMPIDPKGTTSAAFKHTYNILDEHAGDIPVPE